MFTEGAMWCVRLMPRRSGQGRCGRWEAGDIGTLELGQDAGNVGAWSSGLRTSPPAVPGFSLS